MSPIGVQYVMIFIIMRFMTYTVVTIMCRCLSIIIFIATHWLLLCAFQLDHDSLFFNVGLTKVSESISGAGDNESYDTLADISSSIMNNLSKGRVESNLETKRHDVLSYRLAA